MSACSLAAESPLPRREDKPVVAVPGELGATSLPTGVQAAPVGVGRSGVQHACGVYLSRRQAARLIGSGRALQGHRVKPAVAGIVDLVVDQSIHPVTGRHDGVVQPATVGKRRRRDHATEATAPVLQIAPRKRGRGQPQLKLHGGLNAVNAERTLLRRKNPRAVKLAAPVLAGSTQVSECGRSTPRIPLSASEGPEYWSRSAAVRSTLAPVSDQCPANGTAFTGAFSPHLHRRSSSASRQPKRRDESAQADLPPRSRSSPAQTTLPDTRTHSHPAFTQKCSTAVSVPSVPRDRPASPRRRQGHLMASLQRSGGRIAEGQPLRAMIHDAMLRPRFHSAAIASARTAAASTSGMPGSAIASVSKTWARR